jgi:nitrous oxidase accessory protein NosD
MSKDRLAIVRRAGTGRPVWPAGTARALCVGIALSAALVLLFGARVAHAATTFYVDASSSDNTASCGTMVSPCQTIQKAVDNASADDTIQVAAGTYNESVTIDKTLTLEGAQAGNSGSAARQAAPGSESVVTGGLVFIAAAHVTVDGFSFTYAGTQVCIACSTATSGSASDTTIEDNVFSGYQPDNYGDYSVTAALAVNAAPNTHITGNYFTSSGADFSGGGAVVQFFDGGCSGTVVSDNTFDAAEAGALSEIYLYCDSVSGTQTAGTISVTGNHSSNVGDSDFALFTHIDVGDEVDVTDNVVTMTSASSTGIYFSTDPGLETIDISRNTLTGSPFRAVKLTSGAQVVGPVTITGNDFSGNGVGAYFDATSLHSGASVTLRGNDFSDEGGTSDPQAGKGVYNNSTSGAAVDAADNWWGCNAGPGESGCSETSGDVTSDPWLVLGVSASPASLHTGESSTVTADLTHDSDGADASGSGTLLDGTSVSFATDLGTLSASSADTTSGKASVTLGSATAGTANVSSTFGGQTVSTPIVFATPSSTPTTTTSSGGGSPPATTTTVTTIAAAVSETGEAAVPAGTSATVTVGSGASEATVSIPAGAVGSDATLAVTQASPSAPGVSFAAGTAAIQVAVTTTSGQAVTRFAQPLDLAFPAAPSGIVPAYSTGGSSWTEIPQVPSPPTLPDGWPDGWYRDANGTLHILTLHATYFGLLTASSAVTKALQLASGARQTVNLNRTHKVALHLRATLPVTVTVTLVRGKAMLGSWHLEATAAARVVTIVLPKVARRAGHESLRLSAAAGGDTVGKTLPLTLVARWNAG